MASVAKYPGTLVSTGTGNPWQKPAQANANDGLYAYAAVDIATPYTVQDKYIYIVKSDGSYGTTNKAVTGEWAAQVYYYGGSSDKWGEAWSPSDINDADFGVVIAAIGGNYTSRYLKCTNFGFTIPSDATIDGITVEIEKYRDSSNMGVAFVDYVSITVYYTESAPTDELTATDISSGVPTVDKSTIGQTHALTSTSVSTPAPTVDKATLSQIHALVAQDITSGIPEVDKATAGYVAGVVAITSKDIIAGVPTVDKPTIGQIHALVAVDITAGAPVVSKPTLAEIEVHLYDEFVASSIMQQRAEHYRLKDEEESIILLAVMELL